MSERVPVRERYDAVFDFAAKGKRTLFVLVKHTYALLPDGGLAPASPLPLENDVRDPSLQPRLPRESDYWPDRPATDVIVKGTAVSDGGRPFSAGYAVASIAGVDKRVRVTGPRQVRFDGRGGKRIEAEPTSGVPMSWEYAYGGFDDRVRDELFYSKEAEIFLSEADHPGLYPRNPFGRGYMVQPEAPPELWLPQLEDPDDPLTLERLVVGDPRLWWKQPLPWCFDAVHPAAYPRCIQFAPEAEPWHPGPEDDSLPEVARGYLAAGYRTQFEAEGELLHAACVQEASHGMSFADMPPSAPVSVMGMHVEHPRLAFPLPPPPRLVVDAEGVRQEPPMRLLKLVIEASELRCTALHGAVVETHRTWLPGIHPEIPVAVEIDGDLPLRYEAPVPLRDRVAAVGRG